MTFYLAFYLTFDILFGILFGILSDIYSDILPDIYSDILFGIYLAGGEKHLTCIFFGGGYYKIKAVNFAPNITGVCKHIFGISHQATFWRLQKRYRATVSKLFLDAVDMWGLWTCAMYCWYLDLCDVHVMSLSRFVDDSNRRRSHGKPPFRTPESRGVIITFWKAHGMLSHPLSFFPMWGDILGDWHEWTPMAWPSLEKWWFNGLCWRKPWWFAPPNIFVVFCSSVFFNFLYRTPVWIWQFDWAPWSSKPFNHWSKGYPSSRMSRLWRSIPLAPSTCVGPLFQPWKNRPSVAWWNLELERIGWCWKAINLPGKWRSRFLTFLKMVKDNSIFGCFICKDKSRCGIN